MVVLFFLYVTLKIKLLLEKLPNKIFAKFLTKCYIENVCIIEIGIYYYNLLKNVIFHICYIEKKLKYNFSGLDSD